MAVACAEFKGETDPVTDRVTAVRLDQVAYEAGQSADDPFGWMRSRWLLHFAAVRRRLDRLPHCQDGTQPGSLTCYRFTCKGVGQLPVVPATVRLGPADLAWIWHVGGRHTCGGNTYSRRRRFKRTPL